MDKDVNHRFVSFVLKMFIHPRTKSRLSQNQPQKMYLKLMNIINPDKFRYMRILLYFFIFLYYRIMNNNRLSVRRLAALPDTPLPLAEVFVRSNVMDENESEVANGMDKSVLEQDGLKSEFVIELDESVIDDTASVSECSMSDADYPCVPNCLSEQLRAVAVEENMNLSTLSKILHVLRPHHPTLPLDARTLLQTRHNVSITNMGTGRYLHIGIKAGLLLMQNYFSQLGGAPLQLIFNIDAFSMTKGGEKNCWPILCKVSNTPCDVFAVGIYEGEYKPECFNTYLQELVSELKDIQIYGFQFNGVHIQVRIKAFIMDAPVSASVLGIVPYNGYNGCRKCITKGEYFGNVVFPEVNASLRTDDSFRKRIHAMHHKRTTILESIPIDIVDCIPLDPMHLLYLGVVKQMIGLWIESKMSLGSISTVNDRLDKISKYYPQEFQKKTLRIDNYKMWKASDFRVFLLYSGPVVLKGVVSISIYKHFMALSTAARILSSTSHLRHNVAAQDLLLYVVKHFGTLYGVSQITYNVHSLIHLARDSAKFGPLGTFSAFQFQSFLGKLKRRVRSALTPLEQICNKINEFRGSSGEPIGQVSQSILSMQVTGTNKFMRASFPEYTICAKKNGDNCVLLKSGIAVKVTAFTVNNKFYGEEVSNIREFYDKPCSLKNLHFIFVGSFSGREIEFNVNEIDFKMVFLPLKDGLFVFVPLINTTS